MLEVTLIYGLVNSVILALVALGFSLTFSISGVSNCSPRGSAPLAGWRTRCLLETSKKPRSSGS